MSFSSEIQSLLTSSTPFKDFGHTVGVSFEANLAYSALTHFGDFTGKTIDDWAAGERLRVGAALAEKSGFDYPRFHQQLQGVQTSYKFWIAKLNLLAIFWAVLAAAVDVLLLIVMPFYGESHIANAYAFNGILMLFSAIPAGLVGLFLLHATARAHMSFLSWKYKTAIEMIRDAVPLRSNETREYIKENPSSSVDEQPKSKDDANRV